MGLLSFPRCTTIIRSFEQASVRLGLSGVSRRGADSRGDSRPCALSVCIRLLHLDPASSAVGVCQGGLLREGLAATSLPLHGACCPFPLCRPTFTLVSLSGTVDFNSLTNHFKVTQLHHCFQHFGRAHTHTYTHTHARTHARTHAHTHTHIHTQFPSVLIYSKKHV